jgi:hypothetical protein
MEKKTIVVIGDWFVDENWLVTRQSLFQSSGAGEAHFHARHKEVDKRMITLCGAAALLEVLRSHLSEADYEFVGLGAWNQGDNEVIKCTICDKHMGEKRLTPYTLLSLRRIDKNNLKCAYDSGDCVYQPILKNLAPDMSSGGKKTREFSTNRVIRCYEGYGGGRPHLRYRFDWQLPFPEDDLEYGGLSELLKERTVAAVIIEDHGKGVINPKCITELLTVTQKKTKWFVRTKIDNPAWMSQLKQKGLSLELIVSDFKLATHKKGERKWWHDGRELSRAALELLGEMTGDRTVRDGTEIRPTGPNFKSAAILLDDNAAFAKEGDNTFCIPTPPGPRQLLNIGRTTIFYAALVAQRLARREGASHALGDECTKALQCAWKWSQSASGCWDRELIHFYGDYGTALQPLDSPSAKVSSPTAMLYSELWKRWTDSSKGLGIVKVRDDGGGTRDVLQLWRGKGTLGDYICVGGPKRTEINRLASHLGAFVRDKSPAHPFTSLLISAPGWGKSFLARCLAEHFDLDYLEFSIANMSTTRDLVDCFAQAFSRQTTMSKKILIFMDELNANIEGHRAMGLLLSPLWEGTFLIDGRPYRLAPAAWVFASTARLDELVKDDKGSDFVSRLMGPVLELDRLGSRHLADAIQEVRKCLNTISSTGDQRKYIETIYDSTAYTNFTNDDEDVLKTEQVYLMLSLLSAHWGPIVRVQEEVLQLFHDLLPVNGFRSLEIFSRSFELVRQGQLVASNVPRLGDKGWLRSHVVIPKMWLEGPRPADPKRDSDFVDIETVVR